MAASSAIGNVWQGPRISFTLDVDRSHTDTERTAMAYSDGGNGWQSPRISFSFNLSPADRLFPEKRKRADVADINYDTDFEFCVASNNCNGWNSTSAETLLAVADELFVDGKILPLIRCPIKVQPVTIARHLSLEISRSQSPVSSISYFPSNIQRNCSGDVASKSIRHKSPGKWKEIMLKLSNKKKENVFTSEEIDQDRLVSNVKQQPSSGTSLCCPSPFVRRRISAGRKHKAGNFTSCYKRKSVRPWCTSTGQETLPVLVEGSKPLEASSVCNKVQLDPRRRLQAENGKAETKAKQTRQRSKASPGGDIDSHRTTRRILGNRSLMVRNLDRSSTNAAKAASLDSPHPPRRPMVEVPYNSMPTESEPGVECGKRLEWTR